MAHCLITACFRRERKVIQTGRIQLMMMSKVAAVSKVGKHLIHV